MHSTHVLNVSSLSREKIVAYETNLSVTSDDDEMSFLSGQTPDLLSTMSSRHRHTSRNSLLDEIVKQVRPTLHCIDSLFVCCRL